MEYVGFHINADVFVPLGQWFIDIYLWNSMSGLLKSKYP